MDNLLSTALEHPFSNQLQYLQQLYQNSTKSMALKSNWSILRSSLYFSSKASSTPSADAFSILASLIRKICRRSLQIVFWENNLINMCKPNQDHSYAPLHCYNTDTIFQFYIWSQNSHPRGFILGNPSSRTWCRPESILNEWKKRKQFLSPWRESNPTSSVY